MKILLIDPPFHRFMGFYRFYYPLGLAAMAAVLHREGHDCLVYDAEHAPETVSQSWSEASENYSKYREGLSDDHHPVWRELRQVLADYKPDLIGISMLSVKVPSALKTASICKEVFPGVPVVTGGDHPTVFPDKVLKNNNIDIVVRGEGEMTISNLVRHLADYLPLGTVQGIVFRESGQIIHTSPRPLIADLDSLPYPRIEALRDAGGYRPVDFGVIMASRGCPYACTFCGVFNVWSKKVRFRTPAGVVSEIQWLYEKYGTRYFSFRDASFTLHRQWVQEICERITGLGIAIQWECVTRADLLDEKLILLMRQAGCFTIRLGIESGSPELLKKMKKDVDLDEVRKAARLLNQYEFYWSAYFLFGIPDETRETMKETVEFIREIDPPFVTVARFAPIAGTEMYDNLVRMGRIEPDPDWGEEGNQQKHTHYTPHFNEGEFETLMDEVVAWIETRNTRNSARMKLRDGRMTGSLSPPPVDFPALR